MGAAREALLRSLLYGIAVLVNSAAAVVVVRKLDPVGYAVYQAAGKRAPNYVSPLLGLFTLWVYRDAARGLPTLPGALALGLISAAAAGLAALLLAAGLGASLSLGLAAALLAGLTVLWRSLRFWLDAARPVYSGVVVLLQRLLLGVSVAAALLLLRLGVYGVFAAAVASYLAAVALVLRAASVRGELGLRGSPRLLARWLRRLPASLVAGLGPLLLSLDVAVAAAASDRPGETVAAFFAVTSIFILAVEAARYGALSLQGHVLRTRDYASAVAALRLTAAAAAPLLAYPAVYNAHLVYLLNPRYLDAAPAAAPLAAAAMAQLLAAGLMHTAAGLVPEEEEATGVAKSYMPRLAAGLLYSPLLAVGLLAAPPGLEPLAWSLAYLAQSLAQLLLSFRVLPPAARSSAAGALAWTLLYSLLAALASLASPPWGEPGRFWETLAALAPGFLRALLLYAAAALLLDPLLRAAARRGLLLLPVLLRGRSRASL